MSTLTDLIAEALCGAHSGSPCFNYDPDIPGGCSACRLDAQGAAAVVADWLVDTVSCDLIDALTLDSEASAETLAALAAEARKGADQ